MKAVPDPRCGRETKHDHGEVLVCLVAGFLAGRTTIRRSLRWCKKHLEELREYLPLKNGIASPSIACRLLSGIDAELFALKFMEWTGEIVSTKGIRLAVDGKALRAAMKKVKDFRAPMVLNAIDAVTGVVVAQMPIKNNFAFLPNVGSWQGRKTVRAFIRQDFDGINSGFIIKSNFGCFVKQPRVTFLFFLQFILFCVIVKTGKEFKFQNILKTTAVFSVIPDNRDAEGRILLD